MTDDEETGDEFVHGNEQVNNDEDEEMTNAEVEESRNGDAEISDAAKADAEKTKELKDAAKKAKLPPTSSSLSVSSGFGDQFLKLLSDNSLISTVKDTTDVKISSLLDSKIQYEVPHVQFSFVLNIHVSVISEPLVLTPLQETPSVSPITTLHPLYVFTIPPVLLQTTAPIPTPPITIEALTIITVVPEFDALFVVQLRVTKLEMDVSKLKKIDHSTKTLATLKSQVPIVVDNYLGTKFGSVLQKELQKHTADFIQKHFVKPTPESSKIQKPTIDLEQKYEKSALEFHKIKKEQAEKKKMPKYTIKSTDKATEPNLVIKKEQAEKKKMPKYTIKSTDKATLKEYDQKSALYQTMNENKSFNRNPANHALYHALMKALIEDENAMDEGVADTVKNHKRQQDDDDDDNPSARPNQGKKTKRRRTKDSESSKKPSTAKETSKGKVALKSSKTGKFATVKESIEEPSTEVEIDDAVNTAAEDVVHDANQPHDDSTQAKDKALMQDWFKQPPRQPTPDPK
nr:hypothetical protein [Tanacetum cinerariifolium]